MSQIEESAKKALRPLRDIRRTLQRINNLQGGVAPKGGPAAGGIGFDPKELRARGLI